MYGAVASLLLLLPVQGFVGEVLLCGFDGADGATSAPDESLRGHSLVFSGSAQLDTAQSKFGGSSLLLDGSGDAVTVASSSDFLFGAGEFTVEGFVRFNSVSARSTIIGVYDILDERSWAIRKTEGGSGHWQFLASESGFNEESLTPIDEAATTTAGQWYHFAADRDASGVLRLYRDGVMLGKATYASALHASTGKLSIGCRTSGGAPSDGYLNGWLEEIRITRGEALYASDAGFTVPTSAYPRPGDPDVLSAEAGVFALNGHAAALKRALVMPAATGAAALAGNDVALLKGARLTVDAGTFTLTGVNASFLRSLELAAEPGAFALTGNNAGLSTGAPDLVANAGTFTLTGNAAALSRALRMEASAGSFSLVGNAAALNKALKLLADTGSFALTGVSNTFKRALVMSAARATFTLTGNAATLTYSGASWEIAASATLGSNSAGWSGFTLRQRIASAAISNTGGTKVRVTFVASTAGGFVIGNAYIGHQAASGDAYDFEATPTQLTFNGGNAGATVSAGSSIVSDEITFTIEASKNLIISMYFSGTSAVRSGNNGSWQAYYKNANDAVTVNATGYTTGLSTYAVSLVDAYV